MKFLSILAFSYYIKINFKNKNSALPRHKCEIFNYGVYTIVHSSSLSPMINLIKKKKKNPMINWVRIMGFT